YVEDGLLRVHYREIYPIGFELAPELAAAIGHEGDRFVELQSRQVADLLRETVRLTAHVADLELGTPPGSTAPESSPSPEVAAEGLEGLVADADRLQLDIHAFQARIAAALERGSAENGGPGFAPGARYLAIPATDAWWLDHYGDFERHLSERYEALTHAGAPCLVFRLDRSAG